MRDYTGLPHIEQAANATAHGYKDQAIERRHSPVVVRDAAQVCAIAVQHKTEISVQQREQYSRDTKPYVHPNPVLRFPWQAAYETRAQSIHRYSHYHKIREHTGAKDFIKPGPREDWRFEEHEVQKVEEGTEKEAE